MLAARRLGINEVILPKQNGRNIDEDLTPQLREGLTVHLVSTIDEVLAGQRWRRPADWGAFFILFPANRPWTVPSDGWHVDADYAGPLTPPKGVSAPEIAKVLMPTMPLSTRSPIRFARRPFSVKPKAARP